MFRFTQLLASCFTFFSARTQCRRRLTFLRHPADVQLAIYTIALFILLMIFMLNFLLAIIVDGYVSILSARPNTSRTSAESCARKSQIRHSALTHSYIHTYIHTCINPTITRTHTCTHIHVFRQTKCTRLALQHSFQTLQTLITGDGCQ